MFFNLQIIWIILSAIVLSGCTARSGRSFRPAIPGYSESKHQLFVLHKDLLEISGMYYQEDGRIAAINDEIGKIFLINLRDSTHETYKFAGKADYEDVLKLNDLYYVMESNGNIHEVTLGEKVSSVEYKFKSVKKVEFEGMYFEKSSGNIILVTKNHRLADQTIQTYIFDPGTKTHSPEPYFSIRMADIYQKVKNNNIECKPSAVAVHPLTNNLFIIASVGKLMLQCTLDGKVEHAVQLNPNQFPQPEGITFAPNGDMYISNEGLQGKATILRFPYVPVKK